MQRTSRWRPGVLAAAVLALVAAPRGAAAQRPDGFLFGAPAATLTLRGGFDHANAGGDLFAQTFQDYSLSRSSFDGGTLDADLAIRLTPRVALVAGTGLSFSGAPSHFRHFIDNANHEIEQRASFRRVPVTLGVRGYLTSPGRSVGHYAWIPAKVAPFVGVGGGYMHYRFSQSGDFFDPATLAVYPDKLVSSGWAPTAHALAGFDWSLSPRLAVTTEGRYTWARGDLRGVGSNTGHQDYVGFDRIDLSGFAATVGLSVRF